METLLTLLALLSTYAAPPMDPSPGLFTDKAEARNLECTRLSQLEAHARFPGQVPAPRPRELPGQTDALLCSPRLVRLGERDPRDEGVLSTLRQTVEEIAQSAAALGEGPIFHVDAFYPQPQVAQKIAVAARTELAERGQRVSDRVPLLAAGDIAVLGRMAPREAYPLACRRYFEEAALGEGEAFLGLMILDPRETTLHAGLCRAGRWRWLR